MSPQYGYAVNGSLRSTAWFYGSGTYQFQLTVTDGWGLVSSSTQIVTVVPTLTSIAVSPEAPATVEHGNSLQLQARGYDQFGNVLANQPSFSWSMVSGPGSVSSSGLFKASRTPGLAVIKVKTTVNGITFTTTENITIY